MPSVMHEGVIELVRTHPVFAASLLHDLLGVEIPQFADARIVDATLNQVVPIEYRADAVVVLFADNAAPVFGAVFEVQLRRDPEKEFTWPHYVTSARARHRCPFVVAVATPSTTVAQWAGQPIDVGGGMICRPRVIGPENIPKVTDPERARREPELAVLSVMAHGRGDVETAASIGRAAVLAVLPFPAQEQLLYSVLIEKSLSEAARKAMEMEPRIEKFFTEAHRKSFNEGKAEGKIEGKAEGKAEGEAKGKAEGEAKGEAKGARTAAKSLLMLMGQRGLMITEDQRRQIMACTDLATVERWLERALSVTSVEDLLG
jgi:hypothetical protein